jgi:hypothetical protein
LNIAQGFEDLATSRCGDDTYIPDSIMASPPRTPLNLHLKEADTLESEATRAFLVKCVKMAVDEKFERRKESTKERRMWGEIDGSSGGEGMYIYDTGYTLPKELPEGDIVKALSTPTTLFVVDVPSASARSCGRSKRQTIGPYAITQPRFVAGVQQATTLLYTVLLVGAAFCGPKTLILTIWRMGVLLAMYAAIVMKMGWLDTQGLAEDVFLEPLVHGAAALMQLLQS